MNNTTLHPKSKKVKHCSAKQTEEKFVSLTIVAERLQCSVRTVRRMVDIGKLPKAVRVGRLLRLDWGRCVAFLEGRM